MALAIRAMSSVRADSKAELSIVSNARKRKHQDMTDEVQAELRDRPLPDLDHRDLGDRPRRRPTPRRARRRPRPGCPVSDGSRASSRWISAISAMPVTPPAAPAIAERITMLREDRSRNRMRFIEVESSPIVFSMSINLAGQDFGKPLDGRPLHDRVMVAREVMGCDAPERQGVPAPRRPIIEVIPARFRLDQDDAARVGARLVAVQGQPVRPEDVVEPAQAIGADLAGDLATEDRLIESPIPDRFGIEAAEAFERRPSLSARGSGQVGREARQALEVRQMVAAAFRGTGTEQSIRMTSGTSWPAAASCPAISKATMPPIDHPPRM